MSTSSKGAVHAELDPKTLEALRQLKYLTGLSSAKPEQAESSRKGRRGHQRRRKNDSSEDEDDTGREEEEEILPKWKLGLIIAAMLLCFGLLYPTVFAPIVNSFLGRGQPQSAQHQSNPQHPPMHPAMNRQPGASSRPPPHMHPASAKMPEIQPQGGGRGGMFTWLMPFYTIGVVVFLVYTLFKSKTNKKKKKRRRRYDSESEDESEYSHDGDSRTAEPGLGSRKLRSIQQRLRETETAMSKILEQLEGIAQHTQENPGTSADDDVSSKGEPAENNTLSPQQMAEVEERLRELDSLSKLCQEQRDALEDQGQSEEEGRNASSSSESVTSEEEVEPEAADASFDDYDKVTPEDVSSPNEQRAESVEEAEAIAEPEPEQVSIASATTEEQKPARRRRRPKRE